MMIIEDQEHLDKVREFARSVGSEAELQKQLDFLAGFGSPGFRAQSIPLSTDIEVRFQGTVCLAVSAAVILTQVAD